ncbi:MAG: hypothetical protein WC683_19775 [bacterium]
MIDIVHADVLAWAKGYDGPKFHAMLCDPPYHLTDTKDLGNFGQGGFGNRSDAIKEKRRGGFMGKSWDGGDIAFRAETWAALGEHLLPGAFCMAFSGARTYHRMACAIEDAGFVLHSMIGWVYGSGFPKATRIDTQVDRAAGAEREVIGPNIRFGDKRAYPENRSLDTYGGGIAEQQTMGMVTAPATDLAATWSGHRYGLQALKPALEPICVFQKPYAGRPVDSITEYGSGALNIEQSRIMSDGSHMRPFQPTNNERAVFGKQAPFMPTNAAGRWPSNLILQHAPGCKRVGVKRVPTGTAVRHRSGGNTFGGNNPKPPMPDATYADADGLETIDEWQCAEGCAAAALGRMSGERGSSLRHAYENQDGGGGHGIYGQFGRKTVTTHNDTGTAARFFQQCDWALEEAEPFYYCAKASRAERDKGLEGMPTKEYGAYANGVGLPGRTCINGEWVQTGTWDEPNRKPVHNPHPTVKPIALARYLATLLLPPVEYAPRRILIPFAGVASECIGAHLAGWEDVLGIEAEAEYCELARARIAHWCKESLPLFAYAEAAS